MRYEHSPRPDIEYHHHIQELIESQDKRVRDRQMHRDRQVIVEDREKEIASTKPKETLPFWCRKCKLDFVAETIRETERDWGDPKMRIAFYRTKCFKGHWCIRLAVDKWFDPYWRLSRRARADQGKHALDIIQPFESGYELLYGHKKRNK